MVTWRSAFPVEYDTFALQLSYNDEIELHWKITFWSNSYWKLFFHLKFLEMTTCLKVFVTCKYWWWVGIIFFLRRTTNIVQVGVIWRRIQQLLITDISTLRILWHPNPKSFDNVFDQITFFDSLVRCWHIHWDYLSAKVSSTNPEVTKKP